MAKRIKRPKGEYRFRQGSRLPQEKAAVVGRELARLEQNGAVTAERVVDAASVRGHPLHGFFEWDDSKAGKQYRYEQARHLIRSVEVIYEDPVNAPPIRVYIAFDAREGPVDADNRYVSTHVVMSDAESRKRWLRQAMRELISWRNRYQQIAEFAAIFDAIDKLPPDGPSPKKKAPMPSAKRNGRMRKAGPPT